MRSGVQFPLSLQSEARHVVPGLFVSGWSCMLACKRQDETKSPETCAACRASRCQAPPKGIATGNSPSRYTDNQAVIR